MTDLKRYWVFCHKCEEYKAIVDLEEIPHYAGSFKDFTLICPSGNQVFGIERIGKDRHVR